MAKSQPKISLSVSRDIPFNKLVLSQANVRRIKAGVAIEELAEDIARRTLLQSLTVRPTLDDSGAETGMYEVPAGGRRYRALELLVKKKRLARTAPMRANLARPLSLQDVADVAGMSVFHFARGFKRATGMPPHQYLTEQRLAEARTLLHDPGLSIGDVSGAVGFTHSHFTALFAKRMGMTPTRFRQVLLS
jgi:AraC-like DNA-binding protein